jgi:hypothetical protein
MIAAGSHLKGPTIIIKGCKATNGKFGTLLVRLWLRGHDCATCSKAHRCIKMCIRPPETTTETAVGGKSRVLKAVEAPLALVQPPAARLVRQLFARLPFLREVRLVV